MFSTFHEWQTKLVLTRPGRAMPPPLRTLGLWRKISIPKTYLKYTFSKWNMLVLCLYKLEPNQTICFCPTALLDLHGHKIEKHKKSNWSRVREKDTFFGSEKLLFWPWCSCAGRAREPVFCCSGNKLTNAGIAPSRAECTDVQYSRLLCSTYRVPANEPQKHSWLHTNRSGTKRGRGVNWYDVTNPSSQQAAALLNWTLSILSKQANEVFQPSLHLPRPFPVVLSWVLGR